MRLTARVPRNDGPRSAAPGGWLRIRVKENAP